MKTAATVQDLIRAFFSDYLRLTEPDWAGELDFASLSFPWDDSSLLPGERYELGIAAQLSSRRGERITALVRIAERALQEKEVERWLGRQARRLELRLSDPVLVSVVALREGTPGVNLRTAEVSKVCGDTVVRAYYTAFGLEQARAEHFLERPEPLAWGLSALMQPICRSRAAHERACRERIYAAALDDNRRELLLGCIALRRGVQSPRQ
jgi:uncharacterized protein (DUF2384 family)